MIKHIKLLLAMRRLNKAAADFNKRIDAQRAKHGEVADILAERQRFLHDNLR